MRLHRESPVAARNDAGLHRESEKDFTDALIELCKALGYRVCHARPAQTVRGWRTPWQGHAGFPDLIIAGRGRLICAELKAAKGTLAPEQEAWRDVLVDGPCEWYLWKPEDFDAIVLILNR